MLNSQRKEREEENLRKKGRRLNLNRSVLKLSLYKLSYDLQASSAGRTTVTKNNNDFHHLDTPELDAILMNDVGGVGDLEMDLPDDFNESDMPHLVAAEEIIDESLLDAEDKATELPSNNTSLNRLKSQAQSTYMIEKHLELASKPPKNRKTSNAAARSINVPVASRGHKVVVKKDPAKPVS